MSQSDRAIKKFAAQLARLDREVKSWRGAQADFTSIENGGNFTFKDGDGNVTAIVGGQDDGSNTIRHVDGPIPPIPSGLSAHVDGPIVQVSWDGSFEDADTATYDWSHLEVIVVGPSNEQLTATINDITGASTSVAATASGEWTVVARSVSRAEKRSLDGDAGTVTVELTDITGAINDAIGSANGKNTVTYSEVAPTPADEGIVGDTWWVGQVGRPNDIIEATNYVLNPSAAPDGASWRGLTYSGATATDTFQTHLGKTVYRSTLTNGSGYIYLEPAIGYSSDLDTLVPVTEGESLSGAMLVARSYSGDASLRVGFRSASGGHVAWSAYGPSVSVSAAAFTRLTIEDMIVPAGAAYAFMHVSSTSGAPGVWVEGAEAVLSKTPKVPPYFDGATPSGATDNEPHYRWTGTPHASTSEKYLPAIPDSGSDAWNITEQWQYTSAGWKPVEVSHEVIATVDLGKATVGELDGIRIMGQTVRGEQLSGDAIDGKVITGGTYRTTDGTGQWSDDGLFIAQPDGTSMVRFPTDGSPLSLTASDVQIDRASVTDLDLSFGSVRSGGQVTLASGVTAPASPPGLAAGWKLEAKLQRPPEQSMDWRGLAYWNGLYVRAVNVLGSDGDPYDRIELYNPDGSLNRSIQLDVNPQHGVAVIGDTVYTMGNDHNPANTGKNWVHGFNLNTGERVVRWEFTRNVSNQFGVGTDGTNLVFAAVGASGPLYVTRFVPATGASAGVDLITTEWVKYTSDVQGVHISGSTLWVSHREAVREFTVSGSTITYTNNGWVNPNKNGAGMVWRDGVPYVVDGSGNVYKGSALNGDLQFQACFTWFNGTYETTPSPIASVALKPRESVTVSVPERAGLQKRLYISPGISGSWVRYSLAENVTSHVVSNGNLGLDHPPTTNSFPNADPATLKSTNDKFVVKGDGSGHWGNFNVDTNGIMSGLVVYGEQVGTVDAINTPKKTAVTFPSGRFTKPPVVWVIPSTSRPYQVFASVLTEDITTSAFQFSIARTNNTANTTVRWFAMDSE